MPIIEPRAFVSPWGTFAMVLILTGVIEVTSILRGHKPCIGVVFCLVYLAVQMFLETLAIEYYRDHTWETLLSLTTSQSTEELRRLAAFLLTTASAVLPLLLWPVAVFALSARMAPVGKRTLAYTRFLSVIGMAYLALHTLLFPFRFVDALADHGRYRASLLRFYMRLPTETQLRNELQEYEGEYTVEPF